MKKIFTICLMLVAGVVMSFAQTNPERVIITTTTGQQIGALADRVVDITFPVIEGRVACDPEVVSVADDGAVTVNLTRTENCQAFKFTVLSDADKAWYQGDRMVELIDKYGSQAYAQDFANATINGVETKPGTTYWIVTLGYDIYNIPCEVAEVSYTTPVVGLVGNPQVDMTVTGTTTETFSLHFEPNADCSRYYFVAGETGSLESQYQMFAAWMGFTCFEDMIQSWGIEYTGAQDYTYTGMAPGTEYEVFILPLDVNGTNGQYQKYYATTATQGGTGEAHVDVTLGAYEMTEGWWDNDVMGYVSKPSQMITFTPDEQTSCYRYSVVLKENYEMDPQMWQDETAKDNNPDMPYANWYQYSTFTTDFQIDPGVEYVVLTAAKNAANEWGPVDVHYYTTPQLETTVPYAPSQKIAERKQPSQKVLADQKGVAPRKLMNRAAGIRLVK